MAVLFWYLVKSDASARCCTISYTVQDTSTRYQKNTAMFSWSPCIRIFLQKYSVSINKHTYSIRAIINIVRILFPKKEQIIYHLCTVSPSSKCSCFNPFGHGRFLTHISRCSERG